MQSVIVKFEKIHPDAITPTQATAGSAGFDLYSVEDLTLYAGETRVVHTGIKVELPEGYLMYISSKGGPAAKESVFVLNSPGLLDADYRGEIIVILHKAPNVDDIEWISQTCNTNSYKICKGQKIAQFVVLPYPQVKLVEGAVDNNTERGEGRLGSTGLFSTKLKDDLRNLECNCLDLINPTCEYHIAMKNIYWRQNGVG